jgi:hypothetical protein
MEPRPTSGVKLEDPSTRGSQMFGRRTSLGPDELSIVGRIFDDISKELAGDGVTCSNVLDADRTKLAQKVLVLASSRWTDLQIRQLALRACRNEAARRQRGRKFQLTAVTKTTASAAS